MRCLRSLGPWLLARQEKVGVNRSQQAPARQQFREAHPHCSDLQIWTSLIMANIMANVESQDPMPRQYSARWVTKSKEYMSRADESSTAGEEYVRLWRGADRER